jgi:hypothetical protein
MTQLHARDFTADPEQPVRVDEHRWLEDQEQARDMSSVRPERIEQKIGRWMLIAFGLGIALLAALSIAGKGDMDAAGMAAQNNDAKPYEGVMDR